ncbi:MAG TPA: MbnP family copper-binding protein [Polyangia bacterium]|nr:MbnP family copper-binding protein [Polyangia bacterium]
MSRSSIVSLLSIASCIALVGACGGGGQSNHDGSAAGDGGHAGTGGSSSGGGDASAGTDGGASAGSGDASAGTDGGARDVPVDAVADGSSDTSADAGASDGGGDADGGTRAVTLHFKATVGTAAFACGTTYQNQGTTGVSVRPRDFRFYVQSVRLISASGQEVPLALDVRSPWQTADLALLDFEDGTADCVDGNADMNSTITGTVPAGTYTGIVFSNGVPDALNHADPLTLPAPLQAGAMTWGWLYGFKFVKAELGATAAPVGDAGAGLGLAHVGSIGCDNSADGGSPDFNAPPTVVCSQANRNEIRLTGADPTVRSIVADIGAIFAATDLSKDEQCHSEGDACPSMFWSLGLDFATGAQLPTQTVYHFE